MAADIIAKKLPSAFDAGKGRAMKEWVTLPEDEGRWRELALEAHAFVARK